METLTTFLDDPDVVVYRAAGPADVRRIRREVEGRRWAASHGIPTVETVAKDDDDRWLVSRRVVDEPGEPMAYVERALEMSQRIQRLPHPRFASEGATWRAPRRSVAVRVTRLLRAGIDLRTFAAARSAFDALHREVTVHNDYHRENVLNSGAMGRVTVIDWEFTDVGPRHQDMVRLIVDIRDPTTAREAWRLLVASAPPADHPSLAVQLRWLTLRTLASEVCVPPRVLNAAKVAHRRSRWADAQAWADELAPPTGARRLHG